MMGFITNALTRRIETLFPGSFPNARHDHYADYGWPRAVTFDMLHRMSRRNGIAKAAVDKTILRAWETTPAIWESDKPAESDLEADIRQRFEDIRAWQALAEADRRAYVGGYSGAILRLADSQPFSAPVARVPGGLDGLVEIIPAWAGQLKVSKWDSDPASTDYGKPTMFQFNESAVPDGSLVNHGQVRSYDVHPDRVIIWSKDGTVHAPSDLEAGYNDLIDFEKVKGAGGEGFWRNAKAQPVIEVSPDARIEDLAQLMGVDVSKVREALSDEVDEFQSGFNKMLMLAGMTAKPVSVSLPIPEHFAATILQSFAASVSMPLRVLIGNQTGERASTEDQRDWSKTCMARRASYIIPSIRELLSRLERFGTIPERDYTVGWDSLLDASPDDKINRARVMAEINARSGADYAFTADEVREVAGFRPLEEIDMEGEE